MTEVIDEEVELHLVNLSHHYHVIIQVRGTIIRGLGPRHGKAWEMIPWERLFSKYHAHPSPGALSRPTSLAASIGPFLQYIMARQIVLST